MKKLLYTVMIVTALAGCSPSQVAPSKLSASENVLFGQILDEINKADTKVTLAGLEMSDGYKYLEYKSQSPRVNLNLTIYKRSPSKFENYYELNLINMAEKKELHISANGKSELVQYIIKTLDDKIHNTDYQKQNETDISKYIAGDK
jgi:lipoprotein|nr:MAG TPA: Prokaryotic membrane lipoprotein lipid attachment site [Caudoviricetes sp.]DAS91454.1 MAG TPA: Prokaryotic membrane lipoprotein lipid attachment site [Caudoviricetes sp.]